MPRQTEHCLTTKSGPKNPEQFALFCQNLYVSDIRENDLFDWPLKAAIGAAAAKAHFCPVLCINRTNRIVEFCPGVNP